MHLLALEALLRAAALCCIPGARCTLRRGEAEIARKPPSRVAQPLRDRVRPAQPTSARHNPDRSAPEQWAAPIAKIHWRSELQCVHIMQQNIRMSKYYNKRVALW